MFAIIVGALSVLSLAVSVIDIGMNICKALGMFDKDMSAEELGDRALQAQEKGIKLADYKDNFDEYVKEIETIDLDPEISEKYDLAEKNKAAANVLGTGIVEHYGKDSGVDKFLHDEVTESNKDFYTPERAVAYMDTFKNSGENMDNINKYFDNKLDSLQDIRQVDEKLVEAEKKLGVDEDTAKQNLDTEKAKRG